MRAADSRPYRGHEGLYYLPSPFAYTSVSVKRRGFFLASQGTVIARVYTSDAFLPLANVPVTFTQLQPDGSRKLLAVRLTNSSGMTAPLPVETQLVWAITLYAVARSLTQTT